MRPDSVRAVMQAIFTLKRNHELVGFFFYDANQIQFELIMRTECVTEEFFF